MLSRYNYDFCGVTISGPLSGHFSWSFSEVKYLLTQAIHKLPWWLRGKASARNAGDPGSILGLGRSSGEGNGNPLQYSCLENPMDGGA